MAPGSPLPRRRRGAPGSPARRLGMSRAATEPPVLQLSPRSSLSISCSPRQTVRAAQLLNFKSVDYKIYREMYIHGYRYKDIAIDDIDIDVYTRLCAYTYIYLHINIYLYAQTQ